MNSEKEAAVRAELTSPATPEFRGLRAAQLVRVTVLLVIGLAIAFTAPLHEQLGFDRSMFVTALTLIGAATVVEYFALRGTAESWWVAARAIVAFAAAGSALATADSASLALVVTVWAMLTALITLMRLLRGVQPRKVAVPSLLLSVGLALAAILTREDPVAVIGFFGAYAMIRGVFLGISAFDPRTAESANLLDSEEEEPASAEVDAESDADATAARDEA